MSTLQRIKALLSQNALQCAEATRPRRGRALKRSRSVKVTFTGSLEDAAAELDSVRARILIVAKRADLPVEPETLRDSLACEGIELRILDDIIQGDSAEATMIRRITDAIDEYRGHRQEQREHQKTVNATRRRKGLRGPGSLPFGKRLADNGETLEDEPQEAATLRRIIRERETGSSLQAIVDGLNADGVPARGKQWHRTTIDRILRAQVNPSITPR